MAAAGFKLRTGQLPSDSESPCHVRTKVKVYPLTGFNCITVLLLIINKAHMTLNQTPQTFHKVKVQNCLHSQLVTCSAFPHTPRITRNSKMSAWMLPEDSSNHWHLTTTKFCRKRSKSHPMDCIIYLTVWYVICMYSAHTCGINEILCTTTLNDMDYGTPLPRKEVHVHSKAEEKEASSSP